MSQDSNNEIENIVEDIEKEIDDGRAEYLNENQLEELQMMQMEQLKQLQEMNSNQHDEQNNKTKKFDMLNMLINKVDYREPIVLIVLYVVICHSMTNKVMNKYIPQFDGDDTLKNLVIKGCILSSLFLVFKVCS